MSNVSAVQGIVTLATAGDQFYSFLLGLVPWVVFAVVVGVVIGLILRLRG